MNDNEKIGRFRDRTEAGRLLASQLVHYVSRPNLLILSLPRGGVPVAFEIARTLNAPLDIFLVQKLGVPGQEELAMGAVASGNVRVLQLSDNRRDAAKPAPALTVLLFDHGHTALGAIRCTAASLL